MKSFSPMAGQSVPYRNQRSTPVAQFLSRCAHDLGSLAHTLRRRPHPIDIDPPSAGCWRIGHRRYIVKIGQLQSPSWRDALQNFAHFVTSYCPKTMRTAQIARSSSARDPRSHFCDLAESCAVMSSQVVGNWHSSQDGRFRRLQTPSSSSGACRSRTIRFQGTEFTLRSLAGNSIA